MKKYYRYTYEIETAKGLTFEGDGWGAGIGDISERIDRLVYRETGQYVALATITPTGESITEHEYMAMIRQHS